MKAIKLLILPIVVGFLFGCDDSKETIKNLSEQPELQGTFSADCKAVGVEGLASISSKDSIRFRGNQLRVTTNYYSDVNCRKEASIGSLVYEGEFEVERKPVSDQTPKVEQPKEEADSNIAQGQKPNENEGQDTTANADAENAEKNKESNNKDLDAGIMTLRLEEASIKPTDLTLVSLFNGIDFCGVENYEKDKTSNIKKELSGSVVCPIKKFPSTLVGSYVYNEKTKKLMLSEKPTNMPEEKSPEAENAKDKNDVEVTSLPIIEVFAPTYSKE